MVIFNMFKKGLRKVFKKLSPNYQHLILRARRRLFELLGSSRYSKPALDNLDTNLAEYLDYRNGFFIEAGANDGYRQSNTYYFEKTRNWEGILIEPVPELYERCQKNRSSKVYNCALVGDGYERETIELEYADLMTVTKGSFEDSTTEEEHIRKGEDIQDIDSCEIKVPARTLTSILDEVRPEKVDLFSLDVEGYEVEALKGLDFTRYRPKFILVEMNKSDVVDNYLTERNYVLEESYRNDNLYKDRTGG